MSEKASLNLPQKVLESVARVVPTTVRIWDAYDDTVIKQLLLP